MASSDISTSTVCAFKARGINQGAVGLLKGRPLPTAPRGMRNFHHVSRSEHGADIGLVEELVRVEGDTGHEIGLSIRTEHDFGVKGCVVADYSIHFGEAQVEE